jgi:AcrR family transcriptional regulator
MADAKPTRRYSSARRTRQAEQTRADILAAAVKLFAESGWAATTLAAIAAEAGVAVETIYSGFPSKKALLLAAMDVAIVGDTLPVPLFEREPAMRIRTLETPHDRLRQAIAVAGQAFGGPVIGVWRAMLEAGASDPEVARWCGIHERRRRETTTEVIELALRRTIDPRILDGVWAAGSLEVYRKLTVEQGWTNQEWQDWFVDLIERFTADRDSAGSDTPGSSGVRR